MSFESKTILCNLYLYFSSINSKDKKINASFYLPLNLCHCCRAPSHSVSLPNSKFLEPRFENQILYFVQEDISLKRMTDVSKRLPEMNRNNFAYYSLKKTNFLLNLHSQMGLYFSMKEYPWEYCWHGSPAGVHKTGIKSTRSKDPLQNPIKHQ